MFNQTFNNLKILTFYSSGNLAFHSNIFTFVFTVPWNKLSRELSLNPLKSIYHFNGAIFEGGANGANIRGG